MTGLSSTFTAPTEVTGIKLYLTQETVSTPGTPQELINFTVGPNLIRKIYSVKVDARAEGRCTILRDSNLIGSFRTGPASPTGAHVFELPYSVLAGENLVVNFTAVSGTPAVDLACFVQLVETSN